MSGTGAGSSLLFDERTVVVQPSLVRAVGGSVTRAAIVQQINYHVQAGHVEEGGWVVRTYAALGDEIGVNADQVRRAVVALEKLGIIESEQPEGYQRRKRYRLIESALSDSSKWRKRQIEAAKSPLRSGESANTSSLENEETNREKPSVRPSTDFVPTEEHTVYAVAHGLGLRDEVDGWVDYCEAEGKRYKSLNAAFSTWLRRAVQFGRGATTPQSRHPAAQPVGAVNPKPQQRCQDCGRLAIDCACTEGQGRLVLVR